MHPAIGFDWSYVAPTMLCDIVTARDFTALCKPRFHNSPAVRFARHDSPIITMPKEISRSFAYERLFISQEVIISSKNSFRVQITMGKSWNGEAFAG